MDHETELIALRSARGFIEDKKYWLQGVEREDNGPGQHPSFCAIGAMKFAVSLCNCALQAKLSAELMISMLDRKTAELFDDGSIVDVNDADGEGEDVAHAKVLQVYQALIDELTPPPPPLTTPDQPTLMSVPRNESVT